MFRDKYISSVIIITILIIAFLFMFYLFKQPIHETGLNYFKGPYKISFVIDGDTIVIDTGEKVRLIGIDAPEIHHPTLPVQRFGPEAADYLKIFAEKKECMLEFEPGNTSDIHGRLVAYVYVNNILVNAKMLKLGYAYVYTSFHFKRLNEFVAIEKQARESKLGLWK